MTMKGRTAVARLRTAIKLLSPLNCSIAPSASARLPLFGVNTRPPKTLFMTLTATWSWIMSASPNKTTLVSVADSLRLVPGSGFFSSDLGDGDADGAGGPSGKALLNFPVSRKASEYSVPDGWRFLIVSSPYPRAAAEGINCEFGEDLISTVCFNPSAGVPV